MLAVTMGHTYALGTGNQFAGEARRLFAALDGEMKPTELQAAFGLRNEDHFRNACLRKRCSL